MSYIDDLKEMYLEMLNDGKFTYKSIRKVEPIKDWLDIKYGELYILADGFGSIYRNQRSIGYFNWGSIIEFKRTDGTEYINAIIEGNTFKITQDASFGNNPSKSIITLVKDYGEIPLRQFPRIIKLGDLINARKV